MMNSRFAAMIVVPAAAGSLLLGLADSARSGGASAVCTPASLKGGYGLSGPGSVAGRDVGTVVTLVFDGTGGMTGHGTAVFGSPAVVIPVEFQQGTYTLQPDCTGTMHWFGHHPTIAPVDHFHDADVVVSDGGKELAMIFTKTTFPGGTPPVPLESFTLAGHRM